MKTDKCRYGKKMSGKEMQSSILPKMSLPFPVSAALVLLVVLLTNTIHAAREVTSEVIRVACVGDSITQGVHVRGEDNYPSVLGRLLGARYQVRNFGYLGATVMNTHDRPYAATSEFKKATNYNSHIVIFMLGTNDSKPGEWKHKQRFKADLLALIERFAALPPRPKIWLCTPAWVAKHHPGGHDEKIIAGEIIPLIREVAAEKQLPLIDLHAAFEGKPELFADGVHPNAAGCAVLAQAVHKAIVGSMAAPGYPTQRDGTRQRSDIPIRDPFILPVTESNSYFMYRQMSVRLDDGRRRQGVGVHTSKDLQQWDGPRPVFQCPDGFWADQSVWAPEVHRYNGKFYLFVTFTSKDKLPTSPGRQPLAKRGTQILVADSPIGPFKPFANKPHTPELWGSLDGTLWVEDGVPYMIFCHEWTQIGDGTMDVVRLKDDLSDVNGQPRTLFKASDAKWVRGLNGASGFVTDAPFLYRTKSGRLLMTWSSFDVRKKYAVGIAYSTSGKVAGPWQQMDEPLLANDGGHGMLFQTFDGRLVMTIHQPNEGQSRARLYEIEETGDTLRILRELPFTTTK